MSPNSTGLPTVTKKRGTTYIDTTNLRTLNRFTVLPKKHEKFAIEFLKTREGTQSAIAAGYPEAKAATYAAHLLKDPKVRKFIDDEIELALASERSLYRKDLIGFLKDMSSACIHEALNDDGSIKPPSQWSERVKAAVSEYSVIDTPNGRLSKIKFWDRHKSIVLTAKLLDINPLQVVEDTSQVDTTMVNGLTADEIDSNILVGLSSESIAKLQAQRVEEDEALIQASYEPGGVNHSIPTEPLRSRLTHNPPSPAQASSHLLRKIGPMSDAKELAELEVQAQSLKGVV